MKHKPTYSSWNSMIARCKYPSSENYARYGGRDSGAATASGNYGAATASGDSGAATASGNKSAAMSSGRNAKARASIGSAIFLTRRDHGWNITHVFAGIAGQNGIKPDVFYTLDASGNAVEAA